MYSGYHKKVNSLPENIEGNLIYIEPINTFIEKNTGRIINNLHLLGEFWLIEN